MAQDIHICVAPSESYISHCAAMLCSVAEHHQNDHVHVHLFYSGGWDQELSRFVGHVAGLGMSFHQLDVAENLVSAFPETAYPSTVWFPLLAPQLIDLPRVLYLDCDLIVQHNLREIYEVDLEGFWIAGVHDSAVDGDSAEADLAHVITVGLRGVEEYLNSGVLVMDLNAMRTQGIQQRFIEYASNPRSMTDLADQDTINAVAQGHWKRLPMRWNVRQVLLRGEPLVADFPRDELKQARFNPAIVHFTGKAKPWLFSGSYHPFRLAYYKYHQQTPWASDVLPSFSLFERVLCFLPTRVRTLLYPQILRARHYFRALFGRHK